DVFPDVPLRPADPWQRAAMRVLTKFVDEYFCPALTVLGAQNATPLASKIDKEEMARILARMPNEEVRRKWETVSSEGYSEEQLGDARRRLQVCLRRMESQLEQPGDWLLGREYSLADIKWYSMTPALPRVLPELCNEIASPRVSAWLRRMKERRAVEALDAYRRS